ncbi:cyclic nucleotide-binding domain-containing protein [Candidatus Clostridium radicumherbarum]|uniref:Cyclic nucleotide-binding domain-containing protein n=1 Tax=Candidatus Clostridium radicumherbarum TaxID=3381662 RepID=A0ABW8TLR3_9CLOT
MREIANIKKLNYYVSKYNINDIFSTDMKPYMELFFFNKNEYICKANEKLDYLLFFVKGKAKVYGSLSNGKSLLLCFYKPFMIIGDVEFLRSETANSNVQVIEDTYCVGISFDNIIKFAFDDSKFLRSACVWLGEKLIRLSKNSSINLLYPLENRLASFILATCNESKDKNKIIFQGNLTEVSELLGTSYRHLLRTLNLLCSEDAIKKNENYYEIINTSILEKLAGELYE